MALPHRGDEQFWDNADGSAFRLLTFQPVFEGALGAASDGQHSKRGKKSSKRDLPKVL